MNLAPGFNADKMLFLGHVPVISVGEEIVWWSGNNCYVVPLSKGIPGGFKVSRTKRMQLTEPALRSDEAIVELDGSMRLKPRPPIPIGTIGFAVTRS